MSEKFKVDVEFLNPFIDAIIQTLKTTGQVETVTPTQTTLMKDNDTLVSDITGSLTIVAKAFRGSISICFPKETFLKIVSRMLGHEYTTITREIEDAVAEITNVVYGSAKTELNKKGYAMEKAIPSITRGDQHSIRFDAKTPILITHFTSSDGPFMIATALQPT
jgi:chemotaxis protein CheX